MRRRSIAVLGLAALAAAAHAKPQSPREVELSLLQSLATAPKADRLHARGAYAHFLIDQGRTAEALGVLEVMATDRPAVVNSVDYRLMQGTALVGVGRYNEALGVLTAAELASEPQGCQLRLLAYDRLGRPAAAVSEWSCVAASAANLQPAEWRAATFAAVHAYAGLGQWPKVEGLLDQLPAANPEAKYWRGHMAVARGQFGEAKRRLEPLQDTPDPRLRTRVAIDLVEAGLGAGKLKPADAAAKLDRLRYAWRGGGIERDIIYRLMALSLEQGDKASALEWGGMLYRYFNLGAGTSQLLEQLRPSLITSLAPDSPLTLTDRAGLFWRYRDLLPLGSEGDEVIRSLAGQLATAGLYGRAADLLTYQLDRRLAPGAGGSIGLQAARWRMMQGRPDLAMAVLDRTRNRVIDPETAASRDIVEAFALLSTGRGPEAYAMLDGRPERLPAPMVAELLWQARDWRRFLAANTQQLPMAGGRLDDADRTLVVRQAIAAASARDGAWAAVLAARYAPVFAQGPLASAFALLTRPDSPIPPGLLSKALDDLAEAVPPPNLEPWLAAFMMSTAPQPAMPVQASRKPPTKQS